MCNVAANVLISEDGRLQLCDFGIAGVLQTKADKRTTIIGTPYWMPPEMHKQAPPEGVNYGTEVRSLAINTRLRFGQEVS